MAAGTTSSGVLQPADVLAFAFYNVGLQNKEMTGGPWNKINSVKQEKLRNDIAAIFAPDKAMQALFISEFDQTLETIDEDLKRCVVRQPATKPFFEDIVSTSFRSSRCGIGGSKVLACGRVFEVRPFVQFHSEFCHEACLAECTDRHQSWRFQLPYS